MKKLTETEKAYIKEIYPYSKIKKDIIDLALALPCLPAVRKHFGRTENEYQEQNRIFGLTKLKNIRGRCREIPIIER
jgi:hypothetical protein